MEFALVMVLLAIAASADVVRKVDEQARIRANAVASGLEGARNAGNDYLASYYGDINKYSGASGATFNSSTGAVAVSNPLRPSITELRQLGKLPTGHTGRSLIPGGEYQFFITPNPSGCALPSTPGTMCNLEGMVCINAPLRNRNKIDYIRLGTAMKRLGADGGYSSAGTPATISGLGATWSAPNPVTGTPPGLLCSRFGYSSSTFSQYLRKDGTVAMTGNLNVGSNSIDNVADVNANGTVKANQFVTDIKAVGSACSTLGALGSGAGVAMICDGTKWNVDDGLRVTAGTACTQEGSTATSVANGETLVCKRGQGGLLRYVRLVSLISKKILITTAIVQDGTVVTMPTCDVGGVPDFSFDSTQVTLDLTTAPPKQTMYWTATNLSATTWAVKIRLKDNTGGEISGNTVGLTNIMNLECRY
jgi:hypothetical protein